MTFFVVLFKYKKIPIDEFLKYKKNIIQAGIFIGFASLFWAYSINRLGPATTGFITKLSIPFSIILGVLLLHEKLWTKEIVGIIITFIGVIIISYNKDIKVVMTAIFPITQAMFFSFHSLAVKRIVRKVDIWIILLGRCLIAMIIIMSYNLITGSLSMPEQVSNFMIFLVIITPFFGIVLNNYFRYTSLKFISLSKNAALASMEPVMISIMAIIFLGDVMSILKYIGGAVIISGVFVIVYNRKRKKILVSS